MATFTQVVFKAANEKEGFPCMGLASELFPGLVVHEVVEMCDDAGDISEWVISHLPTGYRVPSVGELSLAEALTLAASLAALTEWDKLRSADAVMAWSKTHCDDLRTLLGTAPEVVS